MSDAGLRLAPVRTRRELREFVELPLLLHPKGMSVPLWESAIRRWHGRPDVELWVVRDASGGVVGRSTLHADDRMSQRLGGPTLLLGATEMASPAAFAALAEHAEATARDRGARQLLGPVSLLPNQTGGVITSGWGERGFVDSPWNPAWYPDVWEAQGFTRCFTGATWICERLPDVDPHLFDRGASDRRVVIRRGFRRDLGSQVPMLARAAQRELRPAAVLHTDHCGRDGRGDRRARPPARRAAAPLGGGRRGAGGVRARRPGPLRRRHGGGGRLGPREAVRILARRFLPARGRRREAVLIVKGTRPEYQGRGLNRILSAHLLRGLQEGGYETLRSTFVGDDNPASAAQYERMGGRRLHGTTFYRREVT